ncbi:hypothetical protein F2Q69_00014900 [Brassica cretica]|uniref:Transcription factor TFIIB cyclin-like domain-containing protein n=1 Tax=Brassica cretica TaxID=69181 RepID=A0A8S9QRD1_BRACR|nr:hypothetical protein F2Q69_00014900 [Brassica cretica]
MGVLVLEEPCGVQGPIRLEPTVSKEDDCKSKIDRVHWDMVPWPVRDDVHGLGRTDHNRDPYDQDIANFGSHDDSSSDDDNLKNLGFDPLVVATTQQSNASSDDATIIASMSDRLNLLATVKNQATDISEQIKGQINIPNVRFAASIYIACRQNGMTLSIKEISYVADGVEESKITNAVRSVVKKLGLPPQLMHIRAAEFAKRYSTTLQMDSQAVKAAEEAVERFTDHVNSRYQASDGFVYNHVAKNASSSSDDNLQKLGFDLDVSTTQQSNASSDDATVIASMSDRSVVDKLGLPPQLIHIRAAEFAKRYSTDLQMNRQAIKAAEEAAERCTDHVNRSRPPSSIAAAVVYIIAQLSYEKKLLKDIKEATGVHVNTIKGTYKDLYPHLPKIIPTWFANANDLKKLHSP